MLARELDNLAGVAVNCAALLRSDNLTRAQHLYPGQGIDSDGIDVAEGRGAGGPIEGGVREGILLCVGRNGTPELVGQVGQEGVVSCNEGYAVRQL